MSDGTLYNSCEEYYNALGDNFLNGFYEQLDQEGSIMYCLIPDDEWELGNTVYEKIFFRQNGSLDMYLSWQQSKEGVNNFQEWFSGLDHINKKCGYINSCELVLQMITVDGYKVQVFLENFYIEDESQKYKLYARSTCSNKAMYLFNSFSNHSGQYWRTFDNDQYYQGHCTSTYKGAFWYGYCHRTNPFGPYSGYREWGFCYYGANLGSYFVNLKYMTWLIRDYQTDGIQQSLKGRYQQGTICLKCNHYKCVSCVDSQDNCIKPCNSDCEQCNQESPKCISCFDGTYLFEGQCLICNNSICATCQNNQNECILECNQNCKTCLINQLCDSCNQGWWLNQGSCQLCDNSKCALCETSSINCILQCNSDCQTCNVDGTCKTCLYHQYLLNGQCLECDYKCDQCEFQKFNCINNCSDSTRDFNNNCLCKNTFYDTNKQESICKECSYKCFQCENQFDYCLKCISVLRTNVPLCNCKDNYYEDDQKTCQKCRYNDCLCNQYDTCYQCIGQFISNRQQKTCFCEKGYYENKQKQCQKCSNNCEQCIQFDICIICKKQMGRSFNVPNCECIPGFYLDINTDICQPCRPQCETCINFEYCIKCKFINDKQQLLLPNCQEIQDKLENIIQFQEYDQNGNLVIKQQICSSKCLSCQKNQKNQCNSCSNLDKNRKSIEYNCDCKDGYFDNNGELNYCLKCSINCLTCQHYNVCLSCDITKNQILDEFSLQCKCKLGYYEIIKDDRTFFCKEGYFYQDQVLSSCSGFIQEGNNCKQNIVKKQIPKLPFIYIFISLFLVLLLFMIFVIIKQQYI